jgi:16S rRNA (cytidine1402-2'-O)-methyltransferase
MEPFLSSGLYLVATPIGNLQDITLRALDTLKGVDVIACEDTRVSQVLMNYYGIKTPLISYHDHNGDAMRPKILERISKGEKVALISDAGTPLISDPGYKLVKACYEEGIDVHSLPGPCGLITALTLGGLPTDKFMFLGFLPSKTTARVKELETLKTIEGTLIFYESAKRLQETLMDILQVLGNRSVTVARELTKKFQEIRSGTVQEVMAYYKENGDPRGEIILLVDKGSKEISEIDLESLLRDAMKTHTLKDAVQIVSQMTNTPRKEVYAHALTLTKD